MVAFEFFNQTVVSLFNSLVTFSGWISEKESNTLSGSVFTIFWLFIILFIYTQLVGYLPSLIIHQTFSLRARLVSSCHVTENSSAKTGEYPRFPNFHQTAHVAKKFWRIINTIALSHLGRKYARIFVLGHYLFLDAQFFSSNALGKLFAYRNR